MRALIDEANIGAKSERDRALNHNGDDSEIAIEPAAGGAAFSILRGRLTSGLVLDGGSFALAGLNFAAGKPHARMGWRESASGAHQSPRRLPADERFE